MIVHEYLIRKRHEELLAEAEHYRLANEASQLHGKRFSFYGKLLAWLGGILCNLGSQLEKRFGDETAINHSHSIDRSLEV